MGVGPGPEVLIMKDLGAVPVGSLPADWYMALDRGVFDGIFTSWVVVNTHKLYEVLKTHTEVEMGVPSFPCIMNKKKFMSLPKDQQIILLNNGRWLTDTISKRLDGDRFAGKEICMKRGNLVVTPTSDELANWRKAVEPVWNAWIQERNDKGLPAQEILDLTLELIGQYK